MMEARALKSATPALDNLKSQTSAGYDTLTDRNIRLPVQQSTLDNLATALREQGGGPGEPVRVVEKPEPKKRGTQRPSRLAATPS